MKKIIYILSISLMISFVFTSCTKTKFKGIKDVKLKVDFTPGAIDKALFDLTRQTPDNYIVALKKVVLVGDDNTNDFELFNSENLSSSLVFDFIDTNTTHSLMQGTTVPDGNYTSVKIDIYYLQMKLNISTSSAVEKRNLRIYLSDDTSEDGFHKPGDITQINNTNVEDGWLLGNGVSPDMMPVSPRMAAYSIDNTGDGLGDGTTWLDFAGKPANNFGPFGDIYFMNNEPHPIYYTTLNFDLIDNNGTDIIIDFNVNECWQFEDKDASGAFGAGDLTFDNDNTRWSMQLPKMSVTLE